MSWFNDVLELLVFKDDETVWSELEDESAVPVELEEGGIFVELELLSATIADEEEFDGGAKNA